MNYLSLFFFRKVLIIVTLLLCVQALQAQNFTLVKNKKAVPIYISEHDARVVKHAAEMFANDVQLVTDIRPVISMNHKHICKLLLRLKGNTLWPAMHSCTTPFYKIPENRDIADEYAIVVGTSHCEPMLCNINGEWNNSLGNWEYDTNSKNIKAFFNERIKSTANTEAIYTLGMRGKHDGPMMLGQDNILSRVSLLEKIVSDQRNILLKQLMKPISSIPQIFIPYKEVLECYEAGMKMPDDVTLMWTDDNYGYIRQLSNPQEQMRKGGSGIYYHTSYWGSPHDYLWINSTPPSLIWSEMSKAYQLNAKKIWILNCGDIKPHEQSISLFMDMAFDIMNFTSPNQLEKYTRRWISEQFGLVHCDQIYDILDTYYQLASSRRPEFMAWTQVEPITSAQTTTMSQVNYGDEVQKRMNICCELLRKVEKLKKKVPVNKQDAFYELVYYPVVGAAHLNLKWLYAYKNKFEAKQGRISAEVQSIKSQLSQAVIQKETAYFNNTLASGKWKRNVLENVARVNSPQIIRQNGLHKLNIWMVDPGVSLDQIMIDLGGKKESYAFPDETKIQNH